MKDLFKKILKGTAVFFAVGAALALAAPTVGAWLGVEALGEAGLAAATTGNPVLWTGIFFGGFGALVPMVESGFGFIFGDDKEKSGAEKSEAKQINIVIQQAPQKAHEKAETKWRDKVHAQKLILIADKSAQL